MSADPNHPFGKLVGRVDLAAQTQARADASFEAGRVNYLLTVFKFNAGKTAAALRRAEAAARGTAELTFRAFDEAYPTFPVVLGASRLGGVQLHLAPTAFLPALFRDFGRAPFVTAYEEFYEAAADRADGRPVGLVFPRKGLRHGLVIYAADDPAALPLGEREAVFCYAAGSKKARQWLVVRSFQRTLEAVHNAGHGWRPHHGDE